MLQKGKQESHHGVVSRAVAGDLIQDLKVKCSMEHIEKEISNDYKFNLPAIIDIIRYRGKVLVIAREEANWIVLDNENQLIFFKLLRNNTLGESLSLFDGEEQDAEWVVTQLVARHFEEHAKKQEIIPVAQIYLTNSCNLHCPHCYMMAGEPNGNELTTREVKEILRAYCNNGGVDVKLTGGEISMRSDLLDIIDYGYSLGLHLELLTNGTLWSQDLVNQVANKISVVQISIDGYSEEENAKIRGKNNLEKALYTVDMFAKAKVKTRIAMTAYYSPDLACKAQFYADFANSIKTQYKDYDLDVVIATGLLPGRYGNLTEKESDDYFRIMNEVNSRYTCCHNFEDQGFISRHKSRYILNNCSYGFLSIASNGDVFMCPIVSALKPVANIRTDSLQKIMEISNYAHSLSHTENLHPCNTCELKYICGGDCRIRHFHPLRQSQILNVIRPVSRLCDDSVKERFYDLMIRTNTQIFH